MSQAQALCSVTTQTHPFVKSILCQIQSTWLMTCTMLVWEVF